MLKKFKNLAKRQQLTLIPLFLLLISIGLISFNIAGIRDSRTNAATTTFNGTSSSAVYSGPNFPPESSASCSGGNGQIGQFYDPSSSNNRYYSMRTGIAFSTASIPDDATISSATLELAVSYKDTSKSFTVNIRNLSGGTCSNWGGNPPSASLVGSVSTSSIPSSGSFSVTINVSAINKSGNTNLMFASSLEESNTVPTGAESVAVTLPRLTINYTTPSPPPPSAPTLNFTATSTSIAYNSSTTLNWSSTNATSCTASNSWSGSKATSGSQSTGNLTSNQTYTLSCSGSGGSIQKSVTVTVGSPPPSAPTLNFTASSTSIAYDSATSLNWSSTNATSCTASNSWSGSKATSGSQSTGNLTATKTYTLACSGSGGSIQKSVTVSVGSPPAQPPPPGGGGTTQPPPPKTGSGSFSAGSGANNLPKLPKPSNKPVANILSTIKLKLSVPYLVIKLNATVVVGSFSTAIEIVPGNNEIAIDTRGANFAFGKELTVLVGDNKFLIKKIKFIPTSGEAILEFGELPMGDLNKDNKIDIDDTNILFKAVNRSNQGDINNDGVTNSLDWSILIRYLGRIGD